jgi:hypothetical protein
VDIKNSIITSATFGAVEGKRIALELVKSPSQITLFMTEFLSDDVRFRQRASWVLIYLAKNHSLNLSPHLHILITTLLEKKEDSIKRNILRIFQYMELPKQYHERLINLCFDILIKKEEAIAVQVFAMSVLYNLIKDYPELRRELTFILEEKLPYASPGYKARAKTILIKFR